MVDLVDSNKGTGNVLELAGDRRAADATEDSFEALYRQRYRDVYRYALLMLRRPDEAEDAAGEAFDRAYGAWQSGRKPAGQALPWLLLITRRLVIDKLRRRRLIAWLPIGALGPRHEPSEQPQTGRSEFWIWFETFARELPDRQREVLILRYQRDLDDESIGEIMGLSASGVRSLSARACATLRRNPEIWQ
jgi:RNA polymerase sigma factor (sigma-70 family)